MSFVIKSLAPIVAGGGLGTGGVYIYRGVIPTTWQEYLEREGFQILDTNTDNKEFKAIFVESEDSLKTSDDTKLKAATSVSDYSKIKEYCSSKLKENTDGVAATKSQVIKLCTYSGISTVKAKITEAKKDNGTDLSWIKDSGEDEKYKTIFAVYKYSSKFLEWLNEGKSETDKLQQSHKAEEKYTDLKNKCQEESKKKHENYKEQKQVYNRVYWWCVALSYETVENRIKAVEPTWQQETTGSTIKNTWQYTNNVKETIKTDQSKTEDPEDDDYSGWCTTQLSKKLYEEDVYQDKYLKVKSVCKKQPQKQD